MSLHENDGWPAWSNKVLGDLKDFSAKYEKLSDQVTELKVEFAVLKTKATIYGGAAGVVISGVVTFLAKYFV